jgi:hypothetical protein
MPAASAEMVPFEFSLLAEFLQGLDRSGIDVPEGIFVRDLMQTSVRFLTFPLHPAALIFVALAQHHDVPTRLLDWTRVGLHAAYFAAAGAAKHAAETKTTDGHLSVWALREDFGVWAERDIQDGAKREKREPDAARPQLRVVTAPRASNPNLHAQVGVFTESYSVKVEPIEEIVRSLLRILHEAWPHPTGRKDPPLQRLDLPVSQAPRLLRLLANEQIDGARMFPGREGVVRAMKEHALWDQV